MTNYSKIKIGEDFYPENECVSLVVIKNKKWFLKSDPEVGYDATTKSWDLVKRIRAKKLIPFIVDINHKGEPVYEYNFDSKFSVKVESHFPEDGDSLKQVLQDIKFKEGNKALAQSFLKDPLLDNNGIDRFITLLAVVYRTADRTKPIQYDSKNEKAKINMAKALQVLDTIFKPTPSADGKIFMGKTKIIPLLSTDLKEYYLADYKLTGQVEKQKSTLEIYNRSLAALYEKKKILESSSVYFKGNCYSYITAKKLGFVIFDTSNTMYLESNLSEARKKQIKKQNSSYSFQLAYNVGESKYTDDIIKNYFDPGNPLKKITKQNIQIASLLKGLTFGVEFETTSGKIPQVALKEIGLIPLRDGSIKGFEYATVPLGIATEQENAAHKLAQDLHALNFICDELNEYCKIDERCSMHLHIGNTRRDKLFIIALYILLYKIQDEMFELVPEFKKDGPKYAGLNKNYCQKFKNLGLSANKLTKIKDKLEFENEVNVYYDKIFTLLSNGNHMGPRINRRSKSHPMAKKWDRTERYSWVNIVNTIFSSSQTIEFRLHNATLNKTKVINWLMICSAIVKYTEKNIMEILEGKVPFTIDSIISGYQYGFSSQKKNSAYGEQVYRYLSEYIRSRKEYMRILTNQGDILGAADLQTDSDYRFEFENISCLID